MPLFHLFLRSLPQSQMAMLAMSKAPAGGGAPIIVNNNNNNNGGGGGGIIVLQVRLVAERFHMPLSRCHLSLVDICRRECPEVETI